MHRSRDLSDCKHILNKIQPISDYRWRIVRREIIDLLEVCYGGFYSKPGNRRDMHPTHSSDAKLAADFKLIAKHRRPLSSVRCMGVTASYFGQALRTHQPAWLKSQEVSPLNIINQLKKRRLKVDDHEIMRTEAARLSVYFKNRARSHNGTKTTQQTAMIGLADIFAQTTGFGYDIYTLPHSAQSYFIQFCVKAIGPFSATTEASEEALSSMWRRIKEHHA